MRTALIANGEIQDIPYFLNIIQTFDHIIAIDGGLNYCKQLNLKPQLIIGDWDSIDDHLLLLYEDVPKLSFPQMKDKTDLEIAIEHALTTSTELGVFGAQGKRADHSLYNLVLLSRHPGQVTFYNEKETICALKYTTELRIRPGAEISLLPINGPVKCVTTKGLFWELQDATFNADFMSISNIATADTVTIQFKEGSLLCFTHHS